MGKNKKILLVEDNKFLAKLTSNRLIHEKYETDVARDGDEALSMASEGEYGLILLDLIMPGKDGFEVLAELKKKNNKIPIFVFTNLSQNEDQKEVFTLGAKKYFVKAEVVFDDLLKEIKETMK